MLVYIPEAITLILCIIALYLLSSFYHKMKLKLISFTFSTILIIWIIKSISRVLTEAGVIGIPDIALWSMIGLIQAILLIGVFWYYIKVSEKYL